MRRIWIYAIGLSAAVISSASVAFEEQKLRPAQPAGLAEAAATPGGGVQLSDPGIAPPRLDTGTKVRIPGLGVIGEIPKMDFGLELLYGASQPKVLDLDRNDANGVMGRVTVPLKPSR